MPPAWNFSRIIFFLSVLLIQVIPEKAFSQVTWSSSSSMNTTDTIKKENINRKAKITAAYSAALPGLGQIRNGQVFKAPIIWLGIGAFAYLVSDYHGEYKKYQKAYRFRTDEDSTTIDIFDPDNPTPGIFPVSNQETLRAQREENKRYRDLNIIAGSLFYLIQIMDAYVYAHLKEFDISDDLSLKVITPNFSNIANSNVVRTGIVIRFK